MNRQNFLDILVISAFSLCIPHDGYVKKIITAASEQTVPEQSLLPVFEPHGRILYQARPEAPNQVYIVGQLHRHPITGELKQETIHTQMDIYRIGEQLVKDRSLELVVLEGLTADKSHKVLNLNKGLRVARETYKKVGILEALHTADDQKLEKLLELKKEGTLPEETRHLFSAQAGLWLAIAYNLVVAGAEDKDLYRLAMESAKLVMKTKRIVLIEEKETESTAGPYRLHSPTLRDINPLDHINHINQLRTAYILHNTPQVIEREYAAKRISRQQALVVIGADHIPDCIEFVREDYLNVQPQSGSNAPPLDQSLGYAAAGYGVTVIMPRTIELLKKQK